MKVSIIIVTRNRCRSLEQTLNSLKRVLVPCGMCAELLIVDNGSSDDTREIIDQFAHPLIQSRQILEPTKGKARGLNLGLDTSSGEIILFIDDDVRIPQDWLYAMTTPMIHGKADAVAGGVILAAHLSRPWMTPLHRAWLAETDWLNDEKLVGLVGANMGFRREVLKKIHGFDICLGPGALGFGEEQLFVIQMVKYGFRIDKLLNVQVEHHFDESRLTRAAWLASASARGQSQAYIGHHWLQWQGRLAGMRQLRTMARLRAWRKQFPMPDSIEGCAESELLLVQECACLQAQLLERKKSKSNHLDSYAKA